MNAVLTLKQAFEFLELPESAPKEHIEIRITEKREYFQELAETAPTDFLRKINKKNLDKVGEIQQQFFPWTTLKSDKEVLLPRDEQPIEEPDPLLTTPIIMRSSYRERESAIDTHKSFGWLIRHTEKLPMISHVLRSGKTYFGRKSQPGLTPFVEIADDKYVSRLHAIINVEVAGDDISYFVLDSPNLGFGNMSKNGTYLNGDARKIQGKFPLKNNDTIQIGISKFVFRTSEKELQKNLDEVQSSGYVPTVAVQ
jgi:hypothetical protein